MTNKENVTVLANKALSYMHLGISEAIERVAGTFCEANQELHAAIYDEVQDMMYPHGCGADAVYCEY